MNISKKLKDVFPGTCFTHENDQFRFGRIVMLRDFTIEARKLADDSSHFISLETVVELQVTEPL